MSERVIIRASTLTEQVYEVLKERITSGGVPGRASSGRTFLGQGVWREQDAGQGGFGAP